MFGGCLGGQARRKTAEPVVMVRSWRPSSNRLTLMPRRIHNWDSAHSVYTALCRNHR